MNLPQIVNMNCCLQTLQLFLLIMNLDDSIDNFFYFQSFPSYILKIKIYIFLNFEYFLPKSLYNFLFICNYYFFMEQVYNFQVFHYFHLLDLLNFQNFILNKFIPGLILLKNYSWIPICHCFNVLFLYNHIDQ